MRCNASWLVPRMAIVLREKIRTTRQAGLNWRYNLCRFVYVGILINHRLSIIDYRFLIIDDRFTLSQYIAPQFPPCKPWRQKKIGCSWADERVAGAGAATLSSMSYVGVPTVPRDSTIASSMVVQDYISKRFRGEKPISRK